MVRTRKQVERLPSKRRAPCFPPACEPRITSFFAVRKRKSDDSCPSKLAVDVVKKLHFENDDQPSLRFVAPVLSRTNRLSPLGVFDQVPRFLFDTFAMQASLSTLVKLAQTSQQFSHRILESVLSASGRKRLVRDIAQLSGQQNSLTDPFRMFGLLLKATTCTRNTEERMAILGNFLLKAPTVSSDLSGWGRFIRSFVSRWAFEECEKVVSFMLNLEGGWLRRLVDEVVKSEVGSLAAKEMEARRFLRALLLDQNVENEREASFWLSCLLRTRINIAEQARLVMILYAPTKRVDKQEVIDWRSLCDAVVTSRRDATERLEPIALVLGRLLITRTLSNRRYHWTDNDIFNIVEEISTSPEPWSFDNFVSLLLLGDHTVLPICLSSRMTHNYAEEAGLMVATMRTLLHRWRENVATVLQTPLLATLKALPASSRRAFLAVITEAHAKYARELVSAPRAELEEELRAHHALMPLLIRALATL